MKGKGRKEEEKGQGRKENQKARREGRIRDGGREELPFRPLHSLMGSGTAQCKSSAPDIRLDFFEFLILNSLMFDKLPDNSASVSSLVTFIIALL